MNVHKSIVPNVPHTCSQGRAVVNARVPIAAFEHFDISARFDGCINSHWVRQYVDANLALVQPLCTTLLSWIEENKIKDNRNGLFRCNGRGCTGLRAHSGGWGGGQIFGTQGL